MATVGFKNLEINANFMLRKAEIYKPIKDQKVVDLKPQG